MLALMLHLMAYLLHALQVHTAQLQVLLPVHPALLAMAAIMVKLFAKHVMLDNSALVEPNVLNVALVLIPPLQALRFVPTVHQAIPAQLAPMQLINALKFKLDIM